MSDSFADLWNASAPLPAKTKPQTLTLAARLAMDAEENNKRHRTTTLGVQSHKPQDVSHGTWAGLDLLENHLGTNSNSTRSKDDEDEEDILGVLSKPVEVVIAKKRPVPPPHHPKVHAPPKGQGSGPTTAADIQDQADKLLSQASEIGLSVLSRASAFWKEGKEKVVKVMEERGVGAGFEERGRDERWQGGSKRGGVMNGKPKWMKEVANSEDEFGEEPGGVFKDAFSPVAHFPSTHRPRTLLTTSLSTLSLTSTYKNTGTSQFKLGQYGPASESYTSAITLLPPGHLLLVPLYTNRSLARLRCGEHVGAGEDAGEALKVICVSDSNSNSSSGNGNGIWNPDIEAPELIQAGKERANEGGWLDSRGVGVDLVDGYVKALRRRAEAWEGREKWVEAGRDWEVLAGGGGWIGEGVRNEAVSGAGRCRKMVSASSQNGSSSSSSSASSLPLPKSRPKPKLSAPRPPPSSTPSKALLAHQATTLQAEADDALKHQLKDSVDGRISAWKNGKETNIRALLASLDMVLWDEILMKGGGGVRVNGLRELVTDVQVKKGYVRAIAKVHPDKLNTSNSTVEQRMLANSVFATLNEAWIAFQGGK